MQDLLNIILGRQQQVNIFSSSTIESGGARGARALPEFGGLEKGRSLISSYQSLAITASTLYNAILRIARNFLETRENIKISTHPFYHIILG